jgi:uncharacterized protein (PEP-CTERM system associated)
MFQRRNRAFCQAILLIAAAVFFAATGVKAQVSAPTTSDGASAGTPLADLSPFAASQVGDTQPVVQVPLLQLFGAIDLGETYTTNAGGETGLPVSSSDEYTRAQLQLGARYNSRYSQLFANYSLVGDYYGKYHVLNEYLNYLNMAGAAQVIPDHLYLNATAFASPTLTNRLGAISPGGELLSSPNNSNSYGYQVQPQFIMRLEDIATSTTSVSEGGAFFVYPSSVGAPGGQIISPVQNATSFDANERLASGNYFGRLQWSLVGDYNKLDEQTFSETQQSGTLNLGYAVDRTFTLLATGGYSDFSATVPLPKSLTGPTALGGFSLKPSPSFNLTAQAGIRNQYPTYLGSLHWNIGPLTTMDGILTDAITTPVGGILGNLSGFGNTLLDPTLGTVAVTSTPLGQGFTSQLGTTSPFLSQGLSLDNSIYHDRQANLTITRTIDRMDYSLGFYGDVRRQVDVIPGQDPNSALYGVNASVTRKLWPDLSGYVNASYSYANEFGGHDQILYGTVGLSYSVSETFSLYVLDRYIHRNVSDVTSVPETPLTDDEVVVGLRRNF